MPTSFVLLNSDLGSDKAIISDVKELLSDESDINFEIQGVYGVYDIVLKLTAPNTEKLRTVITTKVRNIPKIQSTLTMMVIDEQEL